METNYDPRKIEAILTEADDLLGRLNSGLIKDMEETRRIQLELYANELKIRKLEVQGKIEKSDSSHFGQTGAGIHEAIDDIAKAMKTLTSYLT